MSAGDDARSRKGQRVKSSRARGPERSPPSRLTRSQFLSAAAGAAGLLAIPGKAYASMAPASGRGSHTEREAFTARRTPTRSFHSRPDLKPPRVTLANVPSSQAGLAEGYSFLGPTSGGGAQSGVLIVDAVGEPVWFSPVASGKWVSNFRAQRYNGQPVLTWWEGKVLAPGYGQGVGVVMDSSYREIARVRAANGRHADLHEFLLTPQGTALLTCYPRTVRANLSGVGGASNGQVFESIIQEIDVRTGRLLLEWRSLDHIPVSDSYVPPGGVYDYLHANSIDLTPDGQLLVSARNTFALYKLARRSGRVIWRLGGKRSNFALGWAARFAWQHDARELADGVITLFDDGAGLLRTHAHSRGVVLDVDTAHRKVRLAHSYRHPNPLLSYAMGNMQTLPDGNVIIGWGNVSVLSEFSPDGSLSGDLWLPAGHDSYRAYRFPWSATPAELPAIASTRDIATGGITLYASWNGATGVSAWQVSVGPSAGALSPVGTAQRSGFETAIALGAASGYAAVTALDASLRRLASSAPLRL
jgi:hypothetical protein